MEKINAATIRRTLAFADQALVSGSNFLLGILLVRTIGLEAYGVFALIWMAVLFALGLNQAFVSKPLLSIAPKLSPEEQELYFSDLHFVQLFVSILFFIGGLFFVFIGNFFFTENITRLVPLISGIVFCQLLHDFYRKINFVKNKIEWVITLDLILYPGQFLLLCCCFYWQYTDLRFVLICMLVANLFSILVGFMKMNFAAICQHRFQEMLTRHFHFSKWLLGTAVLQWFSGNYFIIIGGTLLGTAVVGAIRMVQNIMGLFHILFLTMESIVPVEAARSYSKKGEAGLLQYLQKLTLLLAPVMLLLLCMLVFFSPGILGFVYGKAATNYAYIVWAYAVLYFLVFLGHPFRFYMRTKETTFGIFLAYAISTIFSLFLAKTMILSFGVNGLLGGLVGTQFISLVVYFFFSLKLKNKADFLVNFYKT